MDNVQFTPVTTSSPIGYLDRVSITEPIGAFGWSVDPDNTWVSNNVDCYVDSVTSSGFIGRVPANNPSPDLPYPGNHRYSMPIPSQYRDGNQHQMYCYGIDVTGGDSPTLLTGSPKPFKFNAPIGYLDGIDADGYAYGWSQDLDLPAQSNQVHVYIDGAYIEATNADLPFPTVTPGDHGYRYYIPAQYRNNQQHTLNAYGIDLTGDQNRLLSGSPKTFNLSPVVQSTTFLELPESPLSDNHNAGGGKRIFPDKHAPTDTTDRTIVKVKTKISTSTQGINVYFKSFDIDEPSTDSLPIDTNGTSNGGDNRGFGGSTIYCSLLPLNPCPLSSNAVEYATTDSNGEVVVYISVRSANPGDNFAIAASTKETDVRQASVYGLEIKDSITNRTLQIGADRTDMLTVWRKLHIEIDSMGVVQYNAAVAKFYEEAVVGNDSVTLSVQNFLDSGRFENGRLLVDNDFLEVEKNGLNNIALHSPFYPITVFPRRNYTLYDDDDFNSDNWIGGFDADNGEDITALSDSFNLMQENDDTNCSDGYCNVYAAAYIEPEYSWANPYNTSDIPFVQNFSSDIQNEIEKQIEKGRYPNSSENDDFWIVYIQIDYQPTLSQDCDSNQENCLAGVTPSSIFLLMM